MKARLIFLAMAASVLAACSVEEPQMPELHPRTVKASLGPDTRTHISLNDEGTRASVLWDSGDQILLGIISTQHHFYATGFSTSDSDTKTASFRCSNWTPPFSDVETTFAFYPYVRYTGIGFFSDGSLAVGIAIPPVQTAVKGGVERGLGIAVASEAGDSDMLEFKNASSMVHFTLKGKNASKVRKVVLKSNVFLSGDCILAIDGNDYTINSGMYFTPTKYGQFSDVTLQGTFEEGGDYYIVAAPAVLEGFSFFFYDENGLMISKQSLKTVTLERSHVAEFGNIILNEDFTALPTGVERYMQHTKGKKPVCLAVIGDGFTESEQDLFVSRAHDAIDYLFETEPYKSYREWFNVYVINAVSNESGASVTNGNGMVITEKDTFFKSAWGQNSYSDMGSDESIVFNYVWQRCPEIIDGTVSAADVSILMLINDTRYGGICCNYGSGHSIAHVPYISSGQTLVWQFPDTMPVSDSSPSAGVRSTTTEEYKAIGGSAYRPQAVTAMGDWRNVVVHEFGGHAIGRLADEYWYGSGTAPSGQINEHSWTVPMGLNVSSSYSNVPWKTDLLDNIGELGARDPRYAERIGTFQGGGGYVLNRWRSEIVSCMMDTRLYFSTWQRMLIVKRIMTLAGESFSPDSFLALDNPSDPSREAAQQGAPLNGEGLFPYDGPTGPVRFCPPLAPPKLIEKLEL